MKKHLTFVAILFSMLFAGCSDVVTDTSVQEREKGQNDLQIEKAVSLADNLYRKVYGESTRSERVPSEIKKIYPHGNTRSGDDGYYILNYGYDEGFAVVSVHPSNEGVYAISDEGSLDINDTIDNPGLGIFFASLPSIIEKRDSLVYHPDPGLSPGLVTSQHWDLSFAVEPMLTQSVSKWGQGNPYNDYLAEMKGGYNYNVGCNALAVAQLMSFYSYPWIHGDHSHNWSIINVSNNLNDLNRYGLTNLLYELGLQENLNLKYINENNRKGKEKVGEASGDPNRIKPTLEIFGYTVNADFQDFSENRLMVFLRDKRKPVIMSGKKNDDDSDGHSWICDGLYYDMHKEQWGDMTPTYGGDGLLFHMVWGWNGKANGYFKITDEIWHDRKYDGDNDWPKYSDSCDYKNYRKLRFLGDVEPRNN